MPSMSLHRLTSGSAIQEAGALYSTGPTQAHQLELPSREQKTMWMTASSSTIAANGSKFSRKGLPMAQPSRTITGSTKMAIWAEDTARKLSGPPAAAQLFPYVTSKASAETHIFSRL